MLDVVAELLLELGFDRFVGSGDNRTTARQCCLFVGVVVVLLAVALAVTGGPWYGLAAALVGVALIVYGR
jgi:Flp pilus assembly protein TadB